MSQLVNTARPMASNQLAEELQAARLSRIAVEPISSRLPDFDIDWAYEIQAAGLELRLAAGEQLVGGKLGFTSRAMQRTMGVDSPNYGWLTGAMLIHDRVVHLDQLIHPKVEPEIGFILNADLGADCTAEQVLDATAAVFPCLEVVDSRFLDFKFQLADNIADNSSAGKLVIGDAVADPGAIDLAHVGAVVRVDGRVVATAAGAAALDDPAEAVAWMARAAQPRGLLTGDIVISGGLTAPVDLSTGMLVSVEIDRIGEARSVFV